MLHQQGRRRVFDLAVNSYAILLFFVALTQVKERGIIKGCSQFANEKLKVSKTQGASRFVPPFGSPRVLRKSTIVQIVEKRNEHSMINNFFNSCDKTEQQGEPNVDEQFVRWKPCPIVVR